MKTYPARLVGSYGTLEDHNSVTRDLNVGDVIFRDSPYDGKRYIHFKCVCAFHYHSVSVNKSDVPGSWLLVSENPPHIEPSLLTRGDGIKFVCHLFLHNGELIILDDTSPMPV